MYIWTFMDLKTFDFLISFLNLNGNIKENLTESKWVNKQMNRQMTNFQLHQSWRNTEPTPHRHLLRLLLTLHMNFPGAGSGWAVVRVFPFQNGLLSATSAQVPSSWQSDVHEGDPGHGTWPGELGDKTQFPLFPYFFTILCTKQLKREREKKCRRWKKWFIQMFF